LNNIISGLEDAVSFFFFVPPGYFDSFSYTCKKVLTFLRIYKQKSVWKDWLENISLRQRKEILKSVLPGGISAKGSESLFTGSSTVLEGAKYFRAITLKFLHPNS